MLHVVSTPIGNLEDLSPRAARILAGSELVLAEDTRRTAILLRHIGASVPLRSLHAHNEAARMGEVLARLGAGARIALVSDAGTPLVSDPGERLVAKALEEGHEVLPVPGPSAILHALVGSGLPAVPFTFLGFVPRKGREREALLQRVSGSDETVVLFESPERTVRLIEELAARCGDTRRGCVARELTKLHEEFRRGTLGELAAYYRAEGAPRGEVTVVVAPRPEEDEPDLEVAAERLAAELLGDGTAPSRAARELVQRLGLPRNRAYALVQSLADPSAPPPSGAPPGPGGREPEGGEREP